MSTKTARQTALENALSTVAGYAVTLTVRGLREFTASFDEVDAGAAQKVVEFFGSLATCSVHIDNECGTFVYINA